MPREKVRQSEYCPLRSNEWGDVGISDIGRKREVDCFFIEPEGECSLKDESYSSPKCDKLSSEQFRRLQKGSLKFTIIQKLTNVVKHENT